MEKAAAALLSAAATTALAATLMMVVPVEKTLDPMPKTPTSFLLYL